MLRLVDPVVELLDLLVIVLPLGYDPHGCVQLGLLRLGVVTLHNTVK